jgi:hypothetical protein
MHSQRSSAQHHACCATECATSTESMATVLAATRVCMCVYIMHAWLAACVRDPLLPQLTKTPFMKTQSMCVLRTNPVCAHYRVHYATLKLLLPPAVSQCNQCAAVSAKQAHLFTPRLLLEVSAGITLRHTASQKPFTPSHSSRTCTRRDPKGKRRPKNTTVSRNSPPCKASYYRPLQSCDAARNLQSATAAA